MSAAIRPSHPRPKRLRACDDDDRGLRRLLLDLGLSAPPPTPQRTVERLQWHRAGAARTPVLIAVVQLPSTWQLLEAARQAVLRAEPEREPAIRRGSAEAQDSTGGRDCTWRQYDLWPHRVLEDGRRYP